MCILCEENDKLKADNKALTDLVEIREKQRSRFQEGDRLLKIWWECWERNEWPMPLVRIETEKYIAKQALEGDSH